MNRKGEIELETHHNQPITPGAAQRTISEKKPVEGDPAAKKVVVLRLTEKEYAALEYLGGNSALKQLLCPAGLCIKCRQRAALEASWLDALCGDCMPGEGKN